MTPAGVSRILLRTLAVVVLVVSSVYLFVYLYRWEWNRALISGVFLLASLVMLSTSLVLGSLRRIEQRIDGLSASGAEDIAAATAEENRLHARRHFDWLRQDRLSVFIPVLLGAGVLLSAAAFVIERTAGLLAGPTVDRRIALLLAPDTPLGPPVRGRATAERVAPTRSRRRWTPVAAVVAVVLIAATVVALRALTMARVEPTRTDAVTRVGLEVSHRSGSYPSAELAIALWVSCRSQIPGDVELVDVEGGGSDRVELVVAPGVGPIGRRRLSGCLEDTVIDRVDADVVRVETVPAPRPR